MGGVRRPVFKKTDFDITLKTLTEEEMKGDCPLNKGDDQAEEGDKDDRPKPTHAIIGSVSITSVSCEDQGPYLVRYGRLPKPRPEPRGDKDEGDKKRKDGERKERKDGERKERPGVFFIKVQGCKRSEA